MKELGELCTKHESNSLYGDIDQKKEILKNTVILLNEQIEFNENELSNIVGQLESSNISYTYENTRFRKILYMDDNNVTSNKEHLINQYNVLSERNYKLRLNLQDINAKLLIQEDTDDNEHLNEKEISSKGLSILNAQEKERNRISCDLHDSVVQTLATLVHKTELCIRTMDEDPIGVKLDLQIMMQNIKSVIDEIRTIIYNLRPMAFDDLGLEIAIKRLLESYEYSSKVVTKLEYECDSENINSIINLTLFRIIQESCSNAVKHGRATRINVSLVSTDESIILKIYDNGSGFSVNDIDYKPKKEKTGFGLSIMKERVYLLSGKVNIQSEVNKGTTVTVKIPINISRGI